MRGDTRALKSSTKSLRKLAISMNDRSSPTVVGFSISVSGLILDSGGRTPDLPTMTPRNSTSSMQNRLLWKWAEKPSFCKRSRTSSIFWRCSSRVSEWMRMSLSHLSMPPLLSASRRVSPRRAEKTAGMVVRPKLHLVS